MPTELDQRYDAVLAAVTGPGGRIVVGEDGEGRRIVANFPPTMPAFFKTFCALNGAVEAVISGEERLTFADLDRISDDLARALVARHGIAKGDRVGIAMRNCPSWIVAHMAMLKAGGISTLLNGWWQSAEMSHALDLTEPKLIIADEPRAKRIAAACGPWPLIALPIERPIAEALEPLTGGETSEAELPEIAPEDDATILFTSGSTGGAKGALSTHMAVAQGVYTYATSIMCLLGIMQSTGNPPKNPPKTLLNVPLFHVTGEVPVLLNSFVIGRGMVLMPKWDAGEALRLIEQGEDHLFRGRADDEPRDDEPSRPRPLRPLDPDRHRRRRRPAPGRACPAAEGQLRNRPARARLWPDRNQRRRLRQLLGQLPRQARLDRPRAALCRYRHPGLGRCAPADRRDRRSRRSAPPPTSRAIGRIPKPPSPPSPPTVSSRPATSAISTRTAICSSSTARRTSSSAAARTSVRPRWKRRSMPATRWPRRPCSARPTSGWAKCRSR